MPLVGPVTVFSFAFFWVAILLHTQVSHFHHYGPQSIQQRLPARQNRRVVLPPRAHAPRIGLVVRMQTRPVDQESDAPIDRPPLGRETTPGVRIRVYHLRTKPRHIPRQPRRPTKHRRVLVRTVQPIIPAPTPISRISWKTYRCKKTDSTR